ncbi:AraC family transcriptional regulator [Bacillus altitudinis MN12]|uniref:helix-turn-helix domain-containing protein n=1 Tax=Bacillus TaxID=1386 RepID=UPI0009BDB6C5|nr:MULTISPECIES: helix-turn-helix domain-containing protein [Bacillus]MCA1013515.1 AraC family transcriptional regulator [Bacillus stratosphericus]MBR0581909.1 AraC family transcriptional regulator [Bacillus altitudinis MN12]MBR0594301.1 AraC family transcriptional regulator [Bacillus altitudinis C16B11]MBR0611795.1 AraC family transcriptional regulator [Bacillus altitudinis]MBU4619082.1 helix-turn-helix transcriptional regulator [Bacillus sp. GG161]
MHNHHFLIDNNLKELTEHSTTTWPIALYHSKIRDHMSGYIPLHWHDEFQFVFILEGEAEFHINEKILNIQQGDGVFINSGCLHMAKDANGTTCTYICLNVSPHFITANELFTTFVHPYMHASQTPFILFNRKDGWPNRIYQCIQIIQRLIEQTPAYYELELNIQLITIWKCLLQNRFQLTYDARKHDRNERMKHMLNWIHEHYHEKVLLQDIAREGQLSRSECCRYFNDILKKSPIHYVNEYRIQQSLILLQKTDLNITEIAYQVGFSSTSYFINIFKRIKNTTPLSYRKSKASFTSN